MVILKKIFRFTKLILNSLSFNDKPYNLPWL